ncbi:hypothetical protein GCM10022378_11880 [Salinicoccus jeotgali]|uniref:Uncharacterized protein n=1 Tax=Salinicoccus jeotgali TaxID=381634 RepID=A0ABP7ETB2_9STAP
MRAKLALMIYLHYWKEHFKDMGLLRSGLFFMEKGGGQYALEYK